MKAPEELIQKYMDDVLTTDEDAELRSMLSDDELVRIKKDKGLYQEVLKKLADAPPCPQLLWDHIRKKLQDEPAGTVQETIKFPSFLSFAAMLVLGFGIIGLLLYMNPPKQNTTGPAFVSTVQFASTITDFAAQADVQGQPTDLLASLTAHGFDALKLSDQTTINGHKLKALGIKYCECSGKRNQYCNCSGHQVAQLLFECCGKPVIVLISDKSAPIGADSFRLQGLKNFHITSKEIGNFRLVAAGPHPPDEVLELFAPKTNS